MIPRIEYPTAPEVSSLMPASDKALGYRRAAKLHRASLTRPPKTAAEYLATLEQCRLVETVARLRPHEDEL